MGGIEVSRDSQIASFLAFEKPAKNIIFDSYCHFAAPRNYSVDFFFLENVYYITLLDNRRVFIELPLKSAFSLSIRYATRVMRSLIDRGTIVETFFCVFKR